LPRSNSLTPLPVLDRGQAALLARESSLLRDEAFRRSALLIISKMTSPRVRMFGPASESSNHSHQVPSSSLVLQDASREPEGRDARSRDLTALNPELPITPDFHDVR
jgi:hypothetical protein